MELKTDASVIVGRFQVPSLTPTHTQLIKSVTGKGKRTIVFLGVSPWKNKKNPLDFPTRASMIRETFPDPNLVILPIRDMEDDVDWSDQLDSMIRTVIPHGSVTIFGGRDSFIGCYSGSFNTAELSLGDDSQSGTELREIARISIRSNEHFRAGVIYGALNEYDRVLPTVDILAHIRDDDEDINAPRNFCLIRKKDENFWRLPGGFIDGNDSTGQEAASRELEEETNLVAKPEELRLKSVEIVVDWRSSDDRKVFTSLYSVGLAYSHSMECCMAKDDAHEAGFFTFKQIQTMAVMPSHYKFIHTFISP